MHDRNCLVSVHFSTTDIERWYQLEVASESGTYCHSISTPNPTSIGSMLYAAHKCVEEAQDVKYFSKLQTYYHVR